MLYKMLIEKIELRQVLFMVFSKGKLDPSMSFFWFVHFPAQWAKDLDIKQRKMDIMKCPTKNNNSQKG